MSGPEDLFYDAAVTVLKGPSLYLFDEARIPDYQVSLKQALLASKDKPLSTEALYLGASAADRAEAKLLAGIDPEILKVKWKHQDVLTVPGLSDNVSYDASVVFIKLSRTHIQKFCLLTRLHVERESVTQRQSRRRNRKNKQTLNHTDYLTSKVVLIANATPQVLAIFTSWASKTFDTLFKPIPLLSSQLMLAQYDDIFNGLRGSSPTQLQKESSYLTFDTSAFTATTNDSEDITFSSSSAIKEITVSILGSDLAGYFGQLEPNQTLSSIVFYHYFNITGIDLTKLPLKKFTTKSLIMAASGNFRIEGSGSYWRDQDSSQFWKFIQKIAEEKIN
ncbi:uncharacterized protein SAPINGB_P003548 [Magnusiomyces paraingens]|uniref:Uncharacterized protein n=1 Tax=Magnusiomyces paraingens TaxID=2606893 RepID=A0A5E8BVB1_9ASCO|nr:uncharacterized protein SAPINGB_P003548 [Saprochaete ingens]VVT53387.1 unnamed protein product [Saprochaete ingens]